MSGHLTFRPVLDTQSPAPGCATPSPKRMDDAENATACAQDGDATYELGPAEPGLRVKSARAQNGATAEGIATDEWLVELELTDAAAWEAVTEKHAGKQLAIVLDGVVQSAPMVQEAITVGMAVIAGSFSEADARRVAAVLSGGALPVPVRTVTQTG